MRFEIGKDQITRNNINYLRRVLFFVRARVAKLDDYAKDGGPGRPDFYVVECKPR